MKRILISASCSSLVLLIPQAALATGGPEDVCMIQAVMLVFIPGFFTMLGLLIYSHGVLKGKKEPKPDQGQAPFVLSVICAVLSIFVPLRCMLLANWFSGMVVIMLGFFVVLLGISVASAVLASQVKSRARQALRTAASPDP